MKTQRPDTGKNSAEERARNGSKSEGSGEREGLSPIC